MRGNEDHSDNTFTQYTKYALKYSIPDHTLISPYAPKITINQIVYQKTCQVP